MRQTDRKEQTNKGRKKNRKKERKKERKQERTREVSTIKQEGQAISVLSKSRSFKTKFNRACLLLAY